MLFLLAVLFVAARTWSSVSLGGRLRQGYARESSECCVWLGASHHEALSKRPLADRFGALSLPPAKAWAGLVGWCCSTCSSWGR